MFEITNQWLLFVLDVSAKSLVLVLVAGIAMRLCRVRDSNLRHRIWACVLCGMLVLPLLSYSLPSIPISVPQQWTGTRTSAVPDTGGPLELVKPPTLDNEFAAKATNPTENNLAAIEATGIVGTSDAHPLVAEPDPTTTTAPRATSRRWALPRLTHVLFFAWFSVTAVLAFRLFVGLWSAARILKRAQNITDEVASLVNITPGRIATIRESIETCVPVTVGSFRPTILFPVDWRNWQSEKLQAIVAHELTHVARRDFLVTIGADLNRCLYWFHPVSWWLRTRLSDLAELACDDAAIGQTGDRTGYARHLLEVASQISESSGRVVQPGLAMARESNVESRIATILDFKRPLSERMTWKSTALVALIMVPMIGTAAAVRAVSPTGTETSEAKESKASKTDAVDKGGDEDIVRIHGQVLDPNGKPVSDAKLRIYAVHSPEYYASASEFDLVHTLTTDDEGRFDKSVPRKELIRPADKKYPKIAYTHYGPWTSMIVSAPGYADSYIQGTTITREFEGRRVKTPGFLDSEVPVTLRRPVPIEGRLLNLEGQPVPDVSVSVSKITHHDPARMKDWFAKVSKKPIKHDGGATMMGGGSQRGPYFPAKNYSEFPTSHLAPVTTDAAGRFRIKGLIAQDDVAVLRISGKGIVNRVIHVLGRDMKPVYAHQLMRFSTVGPYYGRKFDYVTQPSVPVFGVVRDIETKEPLANVPVATGGIYGTTMSHNGYLATRTDDQGRYRIEGLPIAPKGIGRHDGNELSVRPDKLPYIESDHFQVPPSDGREPIELNLELRRAVMAKGRLTEKGTGKPLVAEIYYAPFATNENCSKYSTYSSGITTMFGNSSRYHSDENGNFEIPVIAGRGVIAAIVRKSSYITGYGSENIEELKNDKDRKSGNVFQYGHIVPSMYHSLREIDVPEDAKTFEVELETDPGIDVTVKFVGPDGQPLEGVQGKGLGPRQQWQQELASTVTVPGSAHGRIRPVFVTDKDRDMSRFARIVPKPGKTEFEIQLLPKSQLVGRLVDTEGRPLKDVPLEARHQNDPDFMSSLDSVKTDEDGRFEIEMPVGVSYSIVCRTNKTFRVVEDLENSEPKNIDLGEILVDDTAERWTTLEAKNEPVITDLSSTN